MKTTLVASVVLTSLAGVAVAIEMSTPTRIIGTSVEPAAAPARTSQGSTASRANATPVPVSSPIAAVPPVASARSGSTSMEAARPPVPLRVNHKPPLSDRPVVSSGQASADTNGKPSTDTPEAVDARPEQRSHQAAKAAIEADGYKSVQILSQGSNGIWKASALRGKTRVVVNVDQAGNVFTE